MDFTGIVPAIPGLWNGMVMTLKLMAMGVVGGLVLGTLLALMRLSSNKLLANVAGAYVNYFRSIPLLLVITWFYTSQCHSCCAGLPVKTRPSGPSLPVSWPS
ncbi:Amino acid ABC transporter permease [Pseudomonas meliae]|uniref:Amino acid ABC transporter permease n=1 Tax=Pseudomonas meliae TaxID=86176 RepID=A0A0P9YZJ9_9PSED|nr:Amino acid ABC transporter permease [Pseudomonas meliae]